MKVLVTGGNGFLSGHLVHELLRCGYTVRAMMRPGVKAPALTGLDIEMIYGNITSKSDVQAAVRGCDVVIHAAADTSQSHRQLRDYYPVNVEATEQIINAASAEGCRRMIFVSTANTMGFGTIQKPGNENTPVSPVFLKSGYAKSKILAQELVMEAVKNKKIDAVIVNPTFMIGPMDYNPHSGRIFKMLLEKKIAFYPPGGKNFVDVRDAAGGIVNAISKGKSGECYLISGENLSFYDFFLKVKSLSGQTTVLIPVPSPLLTLFGFIGSILRISGISSELNLTNARILCIGNYFDNSKAVRHLCLQCSGIDKTISDSLKWTRTGNK